MSILGNPITLGNGGIDTSDATLTSGSQMLNGVTAYADGVKITGTIQTWQPPVQTIYFWFSNPPVENGTAVRHQAKLGMTWEQWVNSEYNSYGYSVLSSTEVGAISTGSGAKFTISGVTPVDLIESGRTYTFNRVTGGGGDN